jgi:GT2 family glycosyltransferase
VWQCCVLVEAGDPLPAAQNDRIRVVQRTEAWPEADWVLLLAPGDRLMEAALYLFATASTAKPEARILYADECRAEPGRPGEMPWMKPDFDPDLHLARSLFGPATAYRAALAAGLWQDDRDSFALRTAMAVAPGEIHHLPHLLATVAAQPEPTARHPMLAAVLAEQGIAATVEPAPLLPFASRIRRTLPVPVPLVSVIVPTRDRASLLATCAAGVLEQTDYPAIEFIIVDNGSVEPDTMALFDRLRRDPRVRILSSPGPFNYSALNNQAAEAARGEILLLLNNDIAVIEPHWLREMVSQALRPDVGAVGAKLFYGDDTLQHGGVVLGVGGVADHYLPRAARDDPGPFGMLALVREVGAVTGACLAVRRDVYRAVGGLDAKRLTVAFNDIDFCLKVRAAGWRILWTPFAELYHLESASRGQDLSPEKLRRFAGEIATMRERWAAELADDPFYNSNLSLEGAHAVLAAKPRRPVPWRELAR